MIRQSAVHELENPRAWDSADARLGEHYGALLRQLAVMPGGAARGTIGITSCQRGEGVSTVATNLALSLARSGPHPTLLIDANIQAPRLERAFHLPPGPGLAEWTMGTADLELCLRPSGVTNLRLLPAGEWAPLHPAAAPTPLTNDQLEQLRSEYPAVIIDLPAATDLSFCYPLAGMLEGVLLVVQADRVVGQQALRVKQRLERAGARLLGVVFNERK